MNISPQFDILLRLGQRQKKGPAEIVESGYSSSGYILFSSLSLDWVSHGGSQLTLLRKWCFLVKTQKILLILGRGALSTTTIFLWYFLHILFLLGGNFWREFYFGSRQSQGLSQFYNGNLSLVEGLFKDLVKNKNSSWWELFGLTSTGEMIILWLWGWNYR